MVRWHLRDPQVGVVGAVGANRFKSLTWWLGDLVGSSLTPNVTTLTRTAAGPEYVDAVDGFVMAIAAPVAREVRFDERGARAFHGYDIDYCFQARARGFRIVVDEVANVHWSYGGGEPGDGRFEQAAAAFNRTWVPARWPAQWRGSAPYGFFRAG